MSFNTVTELIAKVDPTVVVSNAYQDRPLHFFGTRILTMTEKGVTGVNLICSPDSGRDGKLRTSFQRSFDSAVEDLGRRLPDRVAKVAGARNHWPYAGDAPRFSGDLSRDVGSRP